VNVAVQMFCKGGIDVCTKDLMGQVLVNQEWYVAPKVK
jgi:hypothetical protein